MGLRINTVLSMRGNQQLQRTQKAIARSLERLSSGQRVNSPRDDAAAYRLGVGLTSQIRGIAAANLGINTALGMIETASSAISTQLDIVQRMREIAVQASNGTLSDTDRANLDLEVQTLYSEYNRITSQTNFNGTNLIDGSFGLKTLQAGSNKGDTIQFGIDSTSATGIFIQRTTVGNGTFMARTTVQTGAYPYNHQVIDLNGDGFLDVVTGDEDDLTISIALGNGNGTFRARTTLAANSYPVDIVVADINADGIPDIVSSDDLNNPSTGNIFLGNGNGTFQARTTVANGRNAYGVIARDFNGDGRLDLAFSNEIGSTLSILMGNGNGTFLTRTTVAAGSNPMKLDAADFNGDGKLDLFNADDSGTSVSIYLGNGNGTFLTRTTVSTGNGPIDVASADVNGDGKSDLLSSDGSAAQINIFLGNGNGTFLARTTVRTGVSPWIFTLADVNGDSKLDIINPDVTDRTLSIFFGNGNGTFQTRSTLSTGYTPLSVSVADLNGDGLLDLIATNGGDDAVSVMLGNGTITASTATVSVTTQTRAQNLITALDAATSSLSSYQANLSAIHSRLNETVAGNLLLSENLSEARSAAIDADYSLEVADLVKNQILQSAQIAVLTQANMQQDLILKLLENLK